MVNKNHKQWVVLFQGNVTTIDNNGNEVVDWKSGIQSYDLTLQQANSLALKLNKNYPNVGFWVANEVDDEVQQYNQ